MPAEHVPVSGDRPARGRGRAVPGPTVSHGEQGFILLALLLYWTDLLRIAFPGTDGASVEFRVIHFLFYGVFVLLLARDRPVRRDIGTCAPLLAAFLLLPLLSSLWSINPVDTAQRAIALIGSSLFGVYLALHVPERMSLRLLAATAALAAAASFMLIAFVPSIGLMTEGEYVGVWSGVWIHKNGMGQMAALGALICLIVLRADGIAASPIAVAGLLLNGTLVAGSRSLTSQLVLVTCIVLLFTVGRCLRFLMRHRILVATALLPVLLLAVATLKLDDVFVLLEQAGKDATMSSRLPLWQLLVGFMEGHWWLGYGYEAFWTDANYAIRVIEEKLHFKPHYSHNGYIELVLGLGLVGLGLMAALFGRFVMMIGRGLYQDDRNPLHLAMLVYALTFVLQNTAEVTILMRNHMSWSLFVMLYIYLVRAPMSLTAKPVLSPARPRRLLTLSGGDPERLPVS